jgi:hypothetical protein
MNNAAVRLAKNAIQGIRELKHNRSERAAVERTLSIIATEKGPLTSALRKQADDYARDVLGWSEHAPWLYVYSALAGTFREGWIPDSYYGRVVVPAMQGAYGETSHYKPLSRCLFDSNALPDAAYFVNGLFYSPDLEHVDEAKLKALLFSDSSRVVFKADNMGRGTGITVYTPQSLDTAQIKAHGNGVFQKYIDQHEFFSAFSRSSVATLRMTTTIDDAGKCALRCVYLRIGRDNDTHVKSASAIRIAVDPDSGILSDTGYFPNWLTTLQHPDSHMKFAGNHIPAFDKCVATVLELQRKIPYVRCVGWDVVINRSNDVSVMEWNGYHNDIKFSEASQGPCFRDLHWEKLWVRQRASSGPV